jgi:acyl-CoA reductase-like NAD-dependent aldehyde dehydrogenase
MKNPIMLVCAMVVAMGSASFAAEQAAAEPAAQKAHAGGEKGAKLTPEQREALVNKRLEHIKAKDEALYNELVALRAKDPKAFRAKMREQGKAPGRAKAKAE